MGFAIGQQLVALAGDPNEGLRPDDHLPTTVSDAEESEEDDESEEESEEEDDEEDDEFEIHDGEADEVSEIGQTDHINARMLGSLKAMLDRFGGGLPPGMVPAAHIEEDLGLPD